FLRRYSDHGDAYRVRFLIAEEGPHRSAAWRGHAAGVASPVASLLASPGASLLAITSPRGRRIRHHGADRGGRVLPTSLPYIGVWT
ncbi:MAG TPA: hypothetical protein VG898_10150, partial [Solirubrobacterales bacterium]|nr:hypothetical protein [Solirubrobacterales bacterium]